MKWKKGYKTIKKYVKVWSQYQIYKEKKTGGKIIGLYAFSVFQNILW